MARALEQDELIEHWTLFGDEIALIEGKRGAAASRMAGWNYRTRWWSLSPNN